MTHLKFELAPPNEQKPKTKVYRVISTHDKGTPHMPSAILGKIRWHRGWREYTFEPATWLITIWSADCLKELYEFLKKLKEERERK